VLLTDVLYLYVIELRNIELSIEQRAAERTEPNQTFVFVSGMLAGRPLTLHNMGNFETAVV